MCNGSKEVALRLTNQKAKFAALSKDDPDQPITFDYKPTIGTQRFSASGLKSGNTRLTGCAILKLAEGLIEFMVDPFLAYFSALCKVNR